MNIIGLTPQQQDALDQIEAIIEVRRKTMARLKAASKQTTDPTELQELKLARTRLTRKNLVTVNARNKIMRGGSLGPVINPLRALAQEAKDADKALTNVAEHLQQAATIVNILVRLAGILGV
ncbi:hypothetical protein [uncultured Tateyamaria sp.]|uniref:hypothetical protein n=1 Tax=uncultured Tateyamaria sp. TaxID=455651 RepID=UPI00261FE0E5|nr:hypothetical protein [uncultured Tateyamaria sp.]